MSFLDRPYDSTRTARTSRSTARDAYPITRYRSRFDAHRLIVPACLLAGLVVIAIITMENFS